MSRARPDFATIRLTEAGKRLAGAHGVIRWANSRRHFEFRAGEEHEVERSFEWRALLMHERFKGEPILEEVPEEIVEAVAALDTPAGISTEVDESNTNIEAGDEQGAGRRKRKG